MDERMARLIETHNNKKSLESVVNSYGKYNLTTREFSCKYIESEEAYEYTLLAARKNSGSKGGHRRNIRQWIFWNLYPEQRAIINNLPLEVI